jgi:hypothetical protein
VGENQRESRYQEPVEQFSDGLPGGKQGGGTWR